VGISSFEIYISIYNEFLLTQDSHILHLKCYQDISKRMISKELKCLNSNSKVVAIPSLFLGIVFLCVIKILIDLERI